jgi:uncharacterized membrane protein
MSVNPFDVKTILLAKHAQHVVLIHFPIALFTIGVLFDFPAQWTKHRVLTAAAYYNFLVAAIATVPVIITGLIAWRWALEGQRLKGILLMHLVLGCLSSLLLWIVLLIHKKTQRREDGVLPRYRLPIEAATVVLLTVTGHPGDFLSGVNGPG